MNRGLTLSARRLRKSATEAEIRLWSAIRLKQADGFKFRRQCPIGQYIVDFVCPKKKLVIEVDGGQHSSQEKYDRARTEWLESQGYRVLRFWNNEVLTNLDGVKVSIYNALVEQAAPPTPPSPTRGEGMK